MTAKSNPQDAGDSRRGRKRELIDALRLDDDIRNGIGINDDVEDQAVCDCETREQPSGGVDVDETNRSIKITDGQRPRRPLGDALAAVDTTERPADSVIDTHGAHARGSGGDGPLRAASAAMTLIDGIGQGTFNGPGRPDSTQTPETNSDRGRRRPDEVTPPRATAAVDNAEQLAAEDGLIDTRRNRTGDGYRIDSNKQIMNCQVSTNNASHDTRDKGGPGGQRTDAEHSAQTSDVINAVQTRSMRGARNISPHSPAQSASEAESDNENWTDEELGVEETADTEFRQQSHIDVSDTLTDAQRTAGGAEKQFLNATPVYQRSYHVPDSVKDAKTGDNDSSTETRRQSKFDKANALNNGRRTAFYACGQFSVVKTRHDNNMLWRRRQTSGVT